MGRCWLSVLDKASVYGTHSGIAVAGDGFLNRSQQWSWGKWRGTDLTFVVGKSTGASDWLEMREENLVVMVLAWFFN